MIKDATFVSVWDDGFEVETDCKVNTDTNVCSILKRQTLTNLIWRFLIGSISSLMVMSMTCTLSLTVFPMNLPMMNIGTIKIKFSGSEEIHSLFFCLFNYVENMEGRSSQIVYTW